MNSPYYGPVHWLIYNVCGCVCYSKHYFAFWNNVNRNNVKSAFCKGVEKWLFRVVNYAPVVQYNANLSIHCIADGPSLYFSQLLWSRVWFGLVSPLALAIARTIYVQYLYQLVPLATWHAHMMPFYSVLSLVLLFCSYLPHSWYHRLWDVWESWEVWDCNDSWWNPRLQLLLWLLRLWRLLLWPI